MAYNFNDDRHDLAAEPRQGAMAASSGATDETRGAGETPAGAAQSPAGARFHSCRWQQPIEEGNAAFCTHREVKPYAGTTGFDPQAWCLDCQYYKLRRTPKKRQPQDEYTY